jgi:DNA-binding CsgD family transcriptional regulator/predicted transcriptional regulator
VPPGDRGRQGGGSERRTGAPGSTEEQSAATDRREACGSNRRTFGVALTATGNRPGRARNAVVPPVPEGHERVAELVVAALEAAGRGQVRFVLLSGEAGVGKSHLLGYAQAWAECCGTATWSAAAYPSERNVAYAPFAELVSGLAGGPIRSPEAADLARLAILQAVDERLRQVADGRPLALLMDDLQWFDPASLQLVQFLVRHWRGHGLVAVAALRPGSSGAAKARAAVGPLLQPPLGQELVLGVLSPDAERRLTARLLGGQACPDLAAYLRDGAGGNPLLLVALLDGLRQDGLLLRTAQGWALARQAPAAPAAACTLLRERVRGLDPRPRSLLALLAAAGFPLPADVLARAAAVAEAELQEGLELLDQAGLLGEESPAGGFRPRHELWAEAVLAEVPALERQWLHARLASALQELRPHEPERACAQLAQAGNLGASAGAVDSYLRAARAARAVCAFETAAHHLQRALQLMEAGYRRELRAKALCELGDALALAGATERAVEAWQAGLAGRPAGPDGARQAAALHARLAAAAWEQGRFPASQGHMRRGLDAAGPEPGPEWWELRSLQARLLARRGEQALLADALQAMVAKPPAPEEFEARAAWWTARCTLHLLAADYGDLRADCAEFVAEMEESGDILLLAQALEARTRCLLTVGQHAAAREGAVRAMELLGQAGGGRLGWYARWHLALADFCAGQWAQAAAGLESMLALAHELGLRRYPAQAMALRVVLWARRGELARARREAAQARQVLGDFGADRHVAGLVALAEAVLAVESGDAEAAAAAAERVGAAGWHGLRPLALGWEGEAWALAGRREPVEGCLKHLRQLASRGEALAEALAGGLSCLLARAEGNRTAAAAGAAAAALGLAALDMPVEAARWAMVWEELAPRGERRPPALLAELLPALEQAGAGSLLSRVRAATERAGTAAGRRRASDGLSAREVEILTLVAAGCTDRQVAERLHLSPHTVATHLRRMRERLGCRSRAALVRSALARGWLACTEARPEGG